MPAPVPGSLLTTGRFPLDGNYEVENISNLNDGLIFNGLQRFVKSTQEVYIRQSGIWRIVGSNTTGGAKIEEIENFTATSDGAQIIQLPEAPDGILDLLIFESTGSIRETISYQLDGTNLLISENASVKAGDTIYAKYYINASSSGSSAKFIPLKSSEITADSQGIVGLSLRNSILWLANNRCCGSTPTPDPNQETLVITNVQAL